MFRRSTYDLIVSLVWVGCYYIIIWYYLNYGIKEELFRVIYLRKSVCSIVYLLFFLLNSRVY